MCTYAGLADPHVEFYYVYYIIMFVQSSDSDHSRILLRKARISAMRNTSPYAKRGFEKTWPCEAIQSHASSYSK